MKAAAANLEFEKAATLRDRIKQLRTPRARAGREPALMAAVARELARRAALLEVQEYVRHARQGRRARWSRRPFYYRDIIEQFDAIGIGSLTVVLLTGMFTGMVLALQSGITLDQFGARSMVGRLVSASMVKELGPVLTGLMVAGRVGSGIAAELGSMMVTDQIAALRALGTDPIRKLVVPRILAGLLMVPVLTVIAGGVGMVGGWIVTVGAAPGRRPASTGTASSWASTSRTCGWGSSSRSSSASPSSSIGCHVGLRTTRRHAGRRPRDDERRRGQLGRGDRRRLPRHASCSSC